MGLGNIERVEIIHGPGSVQYGAAGMGGVVNIISKRGKEIPEGRMELGIGSNASHKASFYGGGASGRLDASAAASFYDSGDYRTGEGEVIPNSALGGRYNYYANVGWNFDERRRIGLTFSGSRVTEAGDSSVSAIGSGSAVLLPYRGKPYENRQSKEINTLDLTFEGATESREAEWLLRYFVGKSSYWTTRHIMGVDPQYKSNHLYSQSASHFNGAQAQASYDFAETFKLTAGVDYYNLNMRQYQQNLLYSVITSTTDRSSDAQSVYSNLAFFALARLSLLEKKNLVFSGGVRRDTVKIEIDSVVASNPMPRDERRYSDTIPSFGVAYSPLNELKLRANYGEAFKVATPRELIGNFYMATRLFIGNLSLKPEKSKTFDFGFDLDWRDLTASATYFTTKFQNYIASEDQGTTPPSSKYINIPSSRITGMEASLRFDVGKRLGWDFDLSPYVFWTHIFKYEDSDGNKIPSVSENTLAAGVDFSHPGIGLLANIKATWYDLPKVASYSTQLSPNRIGSKFVWDISVTKDLVEFSGNRDLKLKLSVDNVFDTAYKTDPGYFMDGRVLYVGLIASLN
jgi:vitamin B12 transporter